MSNYRVVFIIPYFGKFNNYFPLFLKSCEANADLCDWLIFTDDRTNHKYPSNVVVKYCKFKWLQKRIRDKFDFEVSIEKPYKLCDYKPAYGYIFEDYISGYSHWGHCDIDLIFGKLSDFLNDKVLRSYEKIFNLGHCTIYQNSQDNNRLFMCDLNGIARYKIVYSSNKNHSFDEEYNNSVNNIFQQNQKRIFEKSYAANIFTKSSDFRLSRMEIESKEYKIEKKKKAFFIWNDGVLVRKEMKKGRVLTKEYMYIHLQSRPMKMSVLLNKDVFKIIPNSFEELELMYDNIDERSFNRIKIKHPNLHYFKLRSRNLIIKIREKLKILRNSVGRNKEM